MAGLLAAALLGGCAAQRPVDSIRASGDRYYARGDFETAASEYREITDRYPGDWKGQYMLGRSLLELGRPTEARRALEVAHTRRPDNDMVVEALAEAMLREGDEATLFAFLRERAADTHAAVDYTRLARYSIEMNDPDSAQTAIDTAIDVDEGHTVEPYLVAADLAQQLGDLDQSVHRLRQAYGVDSNDPRVVERLRAMGEVLGPTLALPPGR
jgi:tetratricopeptide (TPR) repeat protein